MQIFYKNSSPSHCISVKLCAHILFFISFDMCVVKQSLIIAYRIILLVDRTTWLERQTLSCLSRHCYNIVSWFIHTPLWSVTIAGSSCWSRLMVMIIGMVLCCSLTQILLFCFLKLLPVITIIIFTFTFDDNAAADILGVFNTSSVWKWSDYFVVAKVISGQ